MTKEIIHLAESPSLANMKQLAELICRNALPEVIASLEALNKAQ